MVLLTIFIDDKDPVFYNKEREEDNGYLIMHFKENESENKE